MKKYALITGASSGIGEEFAKQLSKDYDKKVIFDTDDYEELESILLKLNMEWEHIIGMMVQN